MKSPSIAKLLSNTNPQGLLPITVVLTHNQQPTRLTCETILRYLPGKRLACQALWEGQRVLAKFFFEEAKARLAFETEYLHVSKLTKKQISTQTVLCAGKGNTIKLNGVEQFLDTDSLYVLLYTFLHKAKTLKEYWAKAELTQKKIIFCQLLKTIAHHHQQGVIQTDLHFGNFLVEDLTITTIDAATIQFKAALDRKQSLQQLGLVLAQATPSLNDILIETLPVYFEARNWPAPSAQEKKTIEHYRDKQHKHISRNHLKKIFRDCSAYQTLKSWKQWAVFSKAYNQPLYTEFYQDPESFLKKNLAYTEIIKNGSSRTTLKLHKPFQLFIKECRIKSIWHVIRQLFASSNAYKSWRNAHLLLHLGILTPKPVAFIQKRIGPFKGTSYFTSELMDIRFILVALQDENLRDGMVQAMCSLLHTMKALRLTHGDLKVSNIMLNKQQEIILVDVEYVKEHRFDFLFKRAFKRDVERFLRNLNDWPELHHCREPFLKAFQQQRLIQGF